MATGWLVPDGITEIGSSVYIHEDGTDGYFIPDLGYFNEDEAASPTVASIVPATGTEDGGTSVVLTGTNYEAVQGTGGVTVDGNAATIDAWGDTEITITTPAGTVGLVDVVVTNDSAGTVTATNGYEYTAAPVAGGALLKSRMSIKSSLSLS